MKRKSKFYNLDLIFLRITNSISHIIILRLLSSRMPANNYDVLVIIKQIVAWLLAVGFLGMATAFPRAIIANRDKVDSRIILLSGLLLLLPGVILPVAFVALNPVLFSKIVFHTESFAYVTRPICLLVCGICVLSLLGLYLRGKERFRGSLSVELLSQSALPLAIILLTQSPILIDRYFKLYGSSAIISALMLLAIILAKKEKAAFGKVYLTVRKMVRELLNFGVPKLLSGLYQMSIVVLLPISLTWSGSSLRVAAATTFGMTLSITAATLLLTPNSLVTFNRIIRTQQQSQIEVAQILKNLLRLAFIGGLAACILGFFGANTAVHYIIGPIYDDYSMFINVGAIIGFLFFAIRLIEIPLDGLRAPWKKARVSIIMFVMTAIFIVLSIAFQVQSPYFIIGALILSLVTYFAVLVHDVIKGFFDFQTVIKDVIKPVCLVVVFGIVYYFAAQFSSYAWLDFIFYLILFGALFLIGIKTKIVKTIFAH